MRVGWFSQIPGLGVKTILFYRNLRVPTTEVFMVSESSQEIPWLFTLDKIDYFAFRHCCYIFNRVVFHLQSLKNNANWPNFIL